MKRALVLGADGLLGENLFISLQNAGFHVLGTVRSTSSYDVRSSPNSIFRFSVGDSISDLLKKTQPEVIFNCIVSKYSQAQENNLMHKRVLFLTNSIFPRQLLHTARNHGIFLFQFSSDAVFSGIKESYHEQNFRFPNTIYGLSKSLGDCYGKNSLLLRFSIVANKKDRLGKINNLSARIKFATKGQVFKADLTPRWNGLTVHSIANLLPKLALQNEIPTGVRHIFTNSLLSKLELISILSSHFNRTDLLIAPITKKNSNSVLSTIYPEDHLSFWSLLGFNSIPSLQDLL